MNLPLLLILFLLFGGERASDVKNLLARIDFASFSPILKLLGLSGDAVDFLSSESFGKLLEGDADLKSLLPTLFSSFGKKQEPHEEDTDGEPPAGNFHLDPINEIAATDVEETLGSYFS